LSAYIIKSCPELYPIRNKRSHRERCHDEKAFDADSLMAKAIGVTYFLPFVYSVMELSGTPLIGHGSVCMMQMIWGDCGIKMASSRPSLSQPI
jgi:hypothetical protein